jgi:hypothetical protein
MRRASWAVLSVLLSASGVFGAWNYTVSQDLTGSGWSSGWAPYNIGSPGLSQGMTGNGVMIYQNQAGFSVINTTINRDTNGGSYPGYGWSLFSHYFGVSTDGSGNFGSYVTVTLENGTAVQISGVSGLDGLKQKHLLS